MIRLEQVKMYFYSRSGLFKRILTKAVDQVNLELDKGKTLALVGESGSGKTTLGKLTLRLLIPTSGNIFFEDLDITRIDEKNLKQFRRRAQAVFQDPYSSIDSFMNIFKIIEEPLLIHQIAEREEREDMVHKSLEEVRLTPSSEYALKYPHELSGGQRQRVSIARALIMNPDYIVADEPVSMIDASSRVEILQLLQGLQQKYRITFLYITHDIATAKYFSDNIGVMFNGRIVEQGTTVKIVSKPLHPYTKRLIDAVPEPDPSNRFKERAFFNSELSSSINSNGCRFYSQCDYDKLDKCDSEIPSMIEIESDHFVACYRD